MHPALRSKLANHVKHADHAALATLLATATDPYDRQQIRLAAHHVAKALRGKRHATDGNTVISFNPGR